MHCIYLRWAGNVVKWVKKGWSIVKTTLFIAPTSSNLLDFLYLKIKSRASKSSCKVISLMCSTSIMCHMTNWLNGTVYNKAYQVLKLYGLHTIVYLIWVLIVLKLYSSLTSDFVEGCLGEHVQNRNCWQSKVVATFLSTAPNLKVGKLTDRLAWSGCLFPPPTMNLCCD